MRVRAANAYSHMVVGVLASAFQREPDLLVCN
jgi:hypothetical protein